MSKVTVYIVDYADETTPASTLDGWAMWLYANDPDDGPGETIADGRSFRVAICDVEYHQAFLRNGELDLPETFSFSHETIAVAYGDGLGWSGDDFIVDAAELQSHIEGLDDGDDIWLATMDSRPGDFTATYTFVDGEPVLQPDGWAL